MLIGRVIDNQLNHYLKATIVSCVKEGSKILDCSVHWMNVQIVGDVVAVILERRGKEGQQPETRDTEILKIIHLLDQARESPQFRLRRYL